MSNNELRDIYAKKAICQIPRLLGNMDRNLYSPTYGCFHRDYWLDKTSDFADAVRQFGVHALALVYTFNFPNNIYKGQEKIRDWAIAAMDFWTKIQHKDGSFDEFYPYERGWVGPSAFTLYTMIESYQLLKNEMPVEIKDRLQHSMLKAAYFVASGENEEDHLANHHAMACLAIWKAYELFNDQKLLESFNSAWKTFLTYHNRNEGWSMEYDGVDPGYLSATVSFLGKVYKTNKDPELLDVLKQSVEFSSYFIYPNGFYAGSLGSRNTLHFYPHGYEILGREIPLANAIAEKMLIAISEDKLVPPEIISDRYVFYRVPEFLIAYLDYTPRDDKNVLLPYEQENLSKYFSESRIFIATSDKYYTVANLAKGGVLKVFNRENGELIFNDCGVIGKLKNGKIVSSQWIDATYKVLVENNNWEVTGYLNEVPSNKLFSPLKNIIFRTVLLLLGWSPKLSHILKGQIRKSLILKNSNIPVRFRRIMKSDKAKIILKDELFIEKKIKFASLTIGDEFFVRYVPQSRYFQSQELYVKGYMLNNNELEELNKTKKYSKTVDVFI